MNYVNYNIIFEDNYIRVYEVDYISENNSYRKHFIVHKTNNTSSLLTYCCQQN